MDAGPANAAARKRRGQSLTEYLILVALVSLLAGGVTSRVADQIRQRYGLVSIALTGRAPAAARAASRHRVDLKAMTPASLKRIQFED